MRLATQCPLYPLAGKAGPAGNAGWPSLLAAFVRNDRFVRLHAYDGRPSLIQMVASGEQAGPAGSAGWPSLLAAFVRNRAEFEAVGARAFSRYKDGRYSMNCFEFRVHVLEEKELLRVWTDEAVAVALEAAAKKRKKSSRRDGGS